MAHGGISPARLTVLVIGGTGVIGREVVAGLLARDSVDRVIVGTRQPDDSGLATLRGAEVLRMDIRTIAMIPDGVDVVVHAAGEKRNAGAMRAVNAEGTRRVAEVAAAAGVERFVYLSSVGVYGAGHRAGYVDERTACRPGNSYEESKLAGEQAVLEVGQRSGMDITVLQPSTVLAYVPGSAWPLLGLCRAVQSGRFIWFGAADAWSNYVPVGDVAKAVVCCVLGSVPPGVYIVNSPASLESLVMLVAEELGVALPRRVLPRWLGWALSHTIPILGVVLGRPLPFDAGKFRELTNKTLFQADSYNQVVGCEQQEGVHTYVRWLVREYRKAGLLA